jgi:hypothetical protein
VSSISQYPFQFFLFFLCQPPWSVFPSRLIWKCGSYRQLIGLRVRGISSVARPLPTHRTTWTQNKGWETFKPRVWLEPTIPGFERAKPYHDLNRAATVIGFSTSSVINHPTIVRCAVWQPYWATSLSGKASDMYLEGRQLESRSKHLRSLTDVST